MQAGQCWLTYVNGSTSARSKVSRSRGRRISLRAESIGTIAKATTMIQPMLRAPSMYATTPAIKKLTSVIAREYIGGTRRLQPQAGQANLVASLTSFNGTCDEQAGHCRLG